MVTSVELQCGHFISQFHVLFLSIAVGGLATQPTTYLLLGIDFGINMHSCYTVYKIVIIVIIIIIIVIVIIIIIIIVILLLIIINNIIIRCTPNTRRGIWRRRQKS